MYHPYRAAPLLNVAGCGLLVHLMFLQRLRLQHGNHKNPTEVEKYYYTQSFWGRGGSPVPFRIRMISTVTADMISVAALLMFVWVTGDRWSDFVPEPGFAC